MNLTDTAKTLLDTRYFKKDEEGNLIEDWPKLCKRVMDYICSGEYKEKYNEMYDILYNQYFLPNSPMLFNAGGEGSSSACFTGDTMIRLIDGTEVPIKDLVSLSEFWVFAYDGKANIPAKGRFCRRTRTNAPIVRVSLENGASIKCTPDHRFMLKDGSYKEVQYIQSEDYLMPLHGEYPRITSIEDIDREDVYCFTVDKYENFALAVGIIVHNCFHFQPQDSMIDIMQVASDSCMVQKYGGGVGFDMSKLRPRGDTVKTTHGKTGGIMSFLELYSSVGKVVTQSGKRDAANMATLRIDHPEIENFIICKKKEGILSNFNISVIITDEFMDCLENDKPFDLKFNNKVYKTINPKTLFNSIVEGAWKNGEPGMLFWGEVMKYDPLRGTPHELTGCNPCGEQLLSDKEACTLSSLNLSKLVNLDNSIDYSMLEHITRLVTRLLDNSIDINIVPIKSIHDTMKLGRKIGIGVMGWADMLYKLRIRYGSQESIDLAEKIMSFIQYNAMDESVILAQERGAFPLFKDSDFSFLKEYSQKYNDFNNLYEKIKTYGIRNATVSTIAPTGCFFGDTKIKLLNGTGIPIKDLVGLTEFHVYSRDSNNKIVPGRAHSCRKTGDNVEIVKITLDNNESIRCTPDHRFMLRDGSYKEAQYLTPDDNLMPSEDRILCNIIIHKEYVGTADVYDFEVDTHHNFALSAGVFVHNSISIIADTSGGIEPNFRLAYTREMFGKKVVMVNPVVRDYLISIGQEDLVDKLINPIDKIPELTDEFKNIFVTTDRVTVEDHIKTQQAFQKFTSNAISKTINLPENATKETIYNAILLGHKSKLKGLTLYRDKSRQSQVLEDGSIRDLPEVLSARRVMVHTYEGKAYLFMTEYKDRAVELFLIPPDKVELDMHTHGVIVAICRCISQGLQGKTDLEPYTSQMKKTIKTHKDETLSYIYMTLKSSKDIESLAVLKMEEADVLSAQCIYGVIKLGMSGEKDLLKYAQCLKSAIRKYGNISNKIWYIGKLIWRALEALHEENGCQLEIEDDTCPECGGKLVMSNGCAQCADCVYVKCG